MGALFFLFSYFRWHYTEAIVDIFGFLRNYLWAIGHIFSIRVLFSTLFVPWKRIEEKGASLFSKPGEFFANVFINLVMRLFGFIIRIGILSFSLLLSILCVLLFIIVLGLWVIIPIMLVQLFVAGVKFLLV